MPSPRPYRIAVISQEADRPVLLRSALESHPLGGCIQLAAVRLGHGEVPDLEPILKDADAILLSHILLDASARAVEEALDRHAPPDAAVVALGCLGPVLARTRLGDFTLRGPGGALDTGALAAILPPGSNFRDDLTAAFQSLLQAPADFLDAIRPALPDLRSYIEAWIYWTNPSGKNLRGLLFMLAHRYGGCDLGGLYEAPERFPSSGVFDPVRGLVPEAEPIPPRHRSRPVVGLLLARGPLITGSFAMATAMMEKLESEGLTVRAVFSESLDFREAVERHLDPLQADALVNLSGFPLVGGHNRCRPAESRTFLAERDMLYFVPPALMLQSEAEWSRNPLGLDPMEVAMQISVHELEGGIEPIPVYGMANADGAVRSLIFDRASRFARRVARWIALRRKPNRDKRVFLSIFAFPPGKGAVGTAAYLDVFRSAHRILLRLEREGYSVEVPETPEDLLRLVVRGADPRAPLHSAELAAGARLTLQDYERAGEPCERIARMWGPPPGSLNTDGRDFIIPGVRLGNVFLGVQPSFGFEGDPMRLLFERGATPHHGFHAYYRYASTEFRADAIIHLGTHGAMEFMPGKQAGLSGECWPDLLIDEVPHLYLYAINNPSEGTIAKRRGYGVTIAHLTPPCEEAGLYQSLASLRSLIAEYRAAPDEPRRLHVAAAIDAALVESRFEEIPPLPPEPAPRDEAVARLGAALTEIETRRIPVGLHTIGRTPAPAECIEILAALACGPDRRTSLARLLIEARGQSLEDLDQRARTREARAVEDLAEIRRLVRAGTAELVERDREHAMDAILSADPRMDPDDVLRVLGELLSVLGKLKAGDEITPLIRGLEGRYIPPGPGGDPSRMPDVLPAGRNLHALDPGSVPSPAALLAAEAAVAALLDKHRRESGRWPTHLGFVLWGLDNIKTQGEAIAQALLLLGVRPRRNSIGRVTELDVIPLDELQRPRVDVTLTTSGIFRDIFALQIALLDRAVRMVAALPEPHEWNPVRARAERLITEGFDEHAARSRVFSNAPGAYGTYIDHMVNLSRWENRSDLALSFVRRKSFRFDGTAEPQNSPDLLLALAKDFDATVQNLDSAEVSLTDVDHYFEYLGGLTALAEHASGRRPRSHVLDATTGGLRVRTLEETVRLETRSKLLNPKWREGLLAHGYEGVEEIRKRLEYTFGWSATAEAVPGWIYGEFHRAYVLNDDVRSRMEESNPHAYQGVLDRLTESATRGFWRPTDEEWEALQALREGHEDLLEGV